MTDPLSAVLAVGKATAEAVGKSEVVKKMRDVAKTVQKLEKFDRTLESLEDDVDLGALVEALTNTVPEALSVVPAHAEYASLTGLPVMERLVEDGFEALDPVVEKLGVDVAYDSFDSIKGHLEKLATGGALSVFVPHVSKFRDLEQKLHKYMDDKFGVVLTAKKVEYLVGSEYVPGVLESAPKIGSLARINHKCQLGAPISRREAMQACRDGAFIVEFVAAKTGHLPIAAGARWVQTALNHADRLEPFLNRDVPTLSHAEDALEISDVSESAVTQWVAGDGVEIGAKITPGDFSERFKALEPHLNEYFLHCCREHEDMGRLFEKRVVELEKARALGPGAVQAQMVQAKRNLAGRFAEQLATDALAPYFHGDVSSEVGAAVGERTTRIDRLFHDAKAPVTGKGGLYVPEGGTLAVESKAGTANYINSQANHLAFQTTGANTAADGTMVITTRDISGLSEQVERELRDGLREQALVYKYFPMKEALDKAVLEALEGAWEASEETGATQA